MAVQTVPAGDERREAHPNLHCDASRLRRHRHGPIPADLPEDGVERLPYLRFQADDVLVEVPRWPAGVGLVTVGEGTSTQWTHPRRPDTNTRLTGHPVVSSRAGRPLSSDAHGQHRCPVQRQGRAIAIASAVCAAAAVGLAWAVTEVERNRLAAVAQRHHDAVVVQERMVQDLVAAKWAIEAGHPERGLEIVTTALTEAQDVVTQLRGDEHTGPAGRRHCADRRDAAAGRTVHGGRSGTAPAHGPAGTARPAGWSGQSSTRKPIFRTTCTWATAPFST
jgi:hypothetical protein